MEPRGRLPRESNHKEFGNTSPLRLQSRPDFGVPFAGKGRGHLPMSDVGDGHLVGVRRLRARLGGHGRRLLGAGPLVMIC